MHATIWMNYAMGGQGALFWLWRQHPAGHEMPHGSFISSWGKPAANYKDLKQLGTELDKHSDLLMNAPVKPARAAIFYCHENDVGLRIEESSNGIRYYTDWTNRFYQPMSDAFVHRDVIHEGVDLEQYDLLFAPMMPMLKPDLRQKLKTWVEKGGTLLLGPMTGYRTEHWTAHSDYAMGDLEPWMGIEVSSRIPVDPYNEDYDQPVEVVMEGSGNLSPSKAGLWSEALETSKGTVLAKYRYGMHDQMPAIIENRVKKGKVVVFGTDPGTDIMKTLIVKYAGENGIQPMASGDEGVLVVPRSGAKDDYLIVINLQNQESKVKLTVPKWYDMLKERDLESSELSLKPYEVLLCRPSNTQSRKSTNP